MRLDIYMKSGNKITLRGIKSWGVQFQGNTVIKLTITRYSMPFMKPETRLIMGATDLSQIEAITETKYFGLW